MSTFRAIDSAAMQECNMFRVKKFFGHVPLETGCQIISSIGMVLYLFVIFLITVPTIYFVKCLKLSSDSDKCQYTIFAHIFLILIYSVCIIIINILLMYGLFFKKLDSIQAWLMLKVIDLIILAITIFLVLFSFNSNSPKFLIFIFLMLLIFSCLEYYYWFCIYSHFLNLKTLLSPPAYQCASSQPSAPNPLLQYNFAAPSAPVLVDNNHLNVQENAACNISYRLPTYEEVMKGS